jgi:pantoate--beta-alanine ligase
VQSVAQQLGLVHLEPRSYLRMLLEKRASHPAPRQPRVVTTPQELRDALREHRRQGHTVGFVPTMGALHDGHRSLIEASRARDGCVVVSIFVNPMQFGPHEDFTRYPRPFEADVALCAAAGVDVIFHPDVETIYSSGYRTYVEVTQLQDVLEGASRPGHFRGVATVVLKLFNLVQPDRAYFGQKDAQQVRVLQQMVRDLAVPVDLVVCPTAREPDGLARSSRNVYLDAQQRAGAVVLSQALEQARQQVQQGQRDVARLQMVLQQTIEREPLAVLDYAAVVDADTLEPVTTITGPVLIALAVRFGSTRLIDNILLA